MKRDLFILLIIKLIVCQSYSLPAFPGAEGYGSETIGGRGGKVIYVENLADSGPGSLRDACNQQGSRTIIFRVAGLITLRTSIVIEDPFITIAGQTAPGDGICIKVAESHKSSAIQVSTHDVVIRHVRLRPGPANIGECCRDALTFVRDAYNCIVDHCSFSWATDEIVNSWYNSHDITIQWSILSEGLYLSSHMENGEYQKHSKGTLFGDEGYNISFHHNLLAHNDDRNPYFTGKGNAQVVNNVVYNWGHFGGKFIGKTTDTLYVNCIGNYFKYGPDSYVEQNNKQDRHEIGVNNSAMTKVHFSGNIGPHRMDTTMPEFAIAGSGSAFREPFELKFLALEQFDMPELSTSTTLNAYSEVLYSAGATLPARDTIDKRIVTEVTERSGKIIDDPSEVGAWPEYQSAAPYPDIDQDGMDDTWEMTQGLDSTDPNDHALDSDADGYTNLEEFLNGTNPNDGTSIKSAAQSFALKVRVHNRGIYTIQGRKFGINSKDNSANTGVFIKTAGNKVVRFIDNLE